MNSLGIDVGTSAVKAVIVDADQHLLAADSEPLTIQHPAPSCSEQDPLAWWTATALVLDRLSHAAPQALGAVATIGLSGQMHGLVALDAADVPLRPAILWNDARALPETARLASLDPDLIARLGVPPTAGYTAPKLLWLADHEPQVWARTRTLLAAKDYLRLQLTGERVTDVSDASGMWLLDATTRDWSPAALLACEVDRARLPRLIEGTAVSGHVRRALAARWGMSGVVVVAGGGGDAACGGVGLGAVRPGDAFVSLGTSGQVFIASDRHSPAPDTMVQAFCHAVPGGWYRVAALLNGASPLAFMAGLLGLSDIGAVLQATEAAFRGPSSLLALPYFSGERTPHNDPLARGALFGLSPATQPTDVVQAVLESVAFSLADGLEALGGSDRGTDGLGFIGGGARSAFWGRIIASVLGRPLRRYKGTEHGAALGAARLGLVAAGMPLGSIVTEPDTRDVIAPDPRLSDAYAPRLSAFRQLYRQTRFVHDPPAS